MARPPSDIKARVIAAARARFLAQGVDGASLRSIANDAQTNIGMIYYYFRTKDDLFLAVVEDAYVGLLASFQSILGTSDPPEQRLQEIYQRIARMDEREFDVVRLIIREALVSSDRMRRLAKRFEHGHIPLMLGMLAEGRTQGRFDAGIEPIALVAATATMAIVPQIVRRLIAQADLPIAAQLPSAEQTAQALASVLLFGIAGCALRDGGRLQ